MASLTDGGLTATLAFLNVVAGVTAILFRGFSRRRSTVR